MDARCAPFGDAKWKEKFGQKTQTNKLRSEYDVGKLVARDHFTSSIFFVAKNSLRRPKIREKTVAAQIFDFMSKWQFCKNSHPSPRKILPTCSTHPIPMLPCIATVRRDFHSHCVQFSETKRNEFDRFLKRFIFKYIRRCRVLSADGWCPTDCQFECGVSSMRVFNSHRWRRDDDVKWNDWLPIIIE